MHAPLVLKKGLLRRPLGETVADTWAWLQADGDPPALAYGSIGLDANAKFWCSLMTRDASPNEHAPGPQNINSQLPPAAGWRTVFDVLERLTGELCQAWAVDEVSFLRPKNTAVWGLALVQIRGQSDASSGSVPR